VSLALSLRGTPYRNGGSDLAGFDCSGFVQYVFSLYGVALPRIVRDQYHAGRKVSLDDVVLSAFLSGPGATTMPLVIFSRARLGLNPSVNAVATIIITFVAVGVVVASYLLARSERRRTLDAALAERPAG